MARRPIPARRSRAGRAIARWDRRLTSMRQRRATAIEASRLATAKRRPLIDLDCWHPRRHTAHDIKMTAGVRPVAKRALKRVVAHGIDSSLRQKFAQGCHLVFRKAVVAVVETMGEAVQRHH